MAESQRFKVLTGLNYPPNNQRAEAGSVVDDLPSMSLAWLLADGYIVETTERLNRVTNVEPRADVTKEE